MPVQLIVPRRFADSRGWFSETYNARRLAEQGISDSFVQDNQSLSHPVGTVRGLHFQTPPDAQAKLVRCLVGAIWDVAVDVRRGSPTYGRWAAATLSAEGGEQLYVPAGFAHGFATLVPDTHVAYKVDAYYAPASDGGLRWDDPDLALPWPLPEGGAQLSDKDASLPAFSDFESPFPYDGRPLERTGSLN